MGDYLTKDYAEKAKALQDKYHPIEVSQKASQEEKNKAMFSWWSEHYELLVKSGLDEKTMARAISDIIKTGTISLRENANIFLKTLKENNIPLIIMSSSGIGNMVVDFLKYQKLMFNNTHFIGNTLEFDKQGKFKGIQDNKIIHVFNKHEVEIKSLPIYKDIKNRKNIILLGDTISDLGMLEGLEYTNLIKIAFLNYPEENLEDFKKNFDIIITNDGSFEYINTLLDRILT
jgi:5'-nucleotidase